MSLLKRCPKCNRMYPSHHKECKACLELETKKNQEQEKKQKEISTPSTNKPDTTKSKIEQIKKTEVPKQPSSADKYVPFKLEGVGIKCASCGGYSPTDKNFCIHCGNPFI